MLFSKFNTLSPTKSHNLKIYLFDLLTKKILRFKFKQKEKVFVAEKKISCTNVMLCNVVNYYY